MKQHHTIEMFSANCPLCNHVTEDIQIGIIIIISRIYNYDSMVIKPKLRSILEIVGDLSDKNDSTNVVDTTVARYAEDLSNEEVNDCLNELELLGLIKMLQRTRNMKGKKDGESFRLLNITKAGLEELLSN